MAGDFLGNEAASRSFPEAKLALLSAFGLHACSGELLWHRVDSGKTPLHRAVRSKQTVRVTRLLAAGANPNAMPPRNCTLLHSAMGSRDLESARMLLESGADPNAANACGDTPQWAYSS